MIEGEVIGGAATPTYQIYWVSEEGTYDTYYTFGSTSPSVMMFMSSMAGTDRKIYVRSDAGYCAENGYGYNNGFSGLISVVYTAVPPQP
ncbi:MAG: hypothetical protein ACRD98_00480 [Nitrososphaera sp.]